MALQIEHEQTASQGENEGDDSDMIFEDWLKSRKISDETICILIKNGIDSKYILAQCESRDIDGELWSSQIIRLQRIKLIGLIAELTHLRIAAGTPQESESKSEIQRIPVNDKEEKVIIKMESKLSYIQNEISLNKEMYQRILNAKIEYNKSIDIFFDDIYDALNKRKQCLLQNISSFVEKQENLCNDKRKSFEIKQREIEKLISKCNDLLKNNSNISIRQNEILQLANQDILTDDIKEEKKYEFDETDEISKINIHLEKPKQLIDIINNLGVISIDPVPIITNLRNNKKDFVVEIEWRLSSQNVDNDNHVNYVKEEKQKLRIEWIDIDNDQIDNDQQEEKKERKSEWIQYECDLSEIANINVIKCGKYSFRMKYFNGERWSNYSNIMEITVIDVILSDKWDENCHSKSLTINGSSIIHSDNKSIRCSAYLTNIVNNGTHHWRFKIEKFEKISGWRQEVMLFMYTFC